MNDSLHLYYSKNTRHREADGNATYRRTLAVMGDDSQQWLILK